MPVMAADSNRLSETMLDVQAAAEPDAPALVQTAAAAKTSNETGETGAPAPQKPRRQRRRKAGGADRTAV